MYASVLTRNPVYSMPHLSLTATSFPVSSVRNGLGLTGTNCGGGGIGGIGGGEVVDGQ